MNGTLCLPMSRNKKIPLFPPLVKTHFSVLLPWWEEEVEEGSFDKLRMPFLLAMVSLSNHPPHLNPLLRRGEKD